LDVILSMIEIGRLGCGDRTSGLDRCSVTWTLKRGFAGIIPYG
jgi:hypothetical protein